MRTGATATHARENVRVSRLEKCLFHDIVEAFEDELAMARSAAFLEALLRLARHPVTGRLGNVVKRQIGFEKPRGCGVALGCRWAVPRQSRRPTKAASMNPLKVRLWIGRPSHWGHSASTASEGTGRRTRHMPLRMRSA